MTEFTKLRIWNQAHQLTLRIYALTGKLPKSELFGLISQPRRAAVSVKSLIAEAEDRFITPDKNKFLIDARASCAEVRTQLLLVKDLYIKLGQEASKLEEEYQILAKQINSLISFRRKNA